MADEAKVKGVLAKVLQGIDDDILEYLVGMVADNPSMDAEEMAEIVGPFLESSGFVESFEHAEPFCLKIVAGLKASDVDMDTNKDDVPKKVNALVLCFLFYKLISFLLSSLAGAEREYRRQPGRTDKDRHGGHQSQQRPAREHHRGVRQGSWDGCAQREADGEGRCQA